MKLKGKDKKKFKFGKYGKQPVNNDTTIKTRKQTRKESRQNKKVDKAKKYFDGIQRIKTFKNNLKNQSIVKPKNVKNDDVPVVKNEKSKSESESECVKRKVFKPKPTDLSKENFESKRDQMALEMKIEEQRKESLLEANRDEDKIINSLEKQLRLNKRKSKSLPASFTSSGLDYILDVCNPEKMKNLSETEKYLQDSGSEFEDDLATIKGQTRNIKRKSKKQRKESDHSSSDEFGSDDESDVDADFKKKRVKLMKGKNDDISDEEFSDDDSLFDGLKGDDESDSDVMDESDFDDVDSSDELTKKNTLSNSKSTDKNNDSESDSEPLEVPFTKKSVGNKNKKVTLNVPDDVSGSDEEKGKFVRLRPNNSEPTKKKMKIGKLSGRCDDEMVSDRDEETLSDEEDIDESDEGKCEVKDDTWEDIYGRKRDKQGNVIEETKEKYVPPALRAQALDHDDKKREALERLRRQLKGLVNRLAENNMHSIATQVEDLYMKNSRNDMNQSIITLFTEAIVSPVHTPERLIMEHAMLTAILHANIGTEVGAYILQTFVTSFDKLLNEGSEIGDKRLDNLITFICHLYTFKIFDNSLLYDLLKKLCAMFTEKEIELILVVLRSVGFSLRKDDPVALKELVLKIQRLASEATTLKNDSRVSFMLDTLLKIKNNNMSKLPQYDPTHSEHLKKLLKTMIRKGNYVTELKISLEDLLKADERGRWWIVGSAWTGPESGENADEGQVNAEPSLTPSMSEQLGQLAKKLRINTDVRKNIFCVLMTAEDYNDAFEKLHKLGLKGQMMTEIIHVLLHCLLQEKEYNHYYALIGNRFCSSDRKHRMVIQYSLWDKFKEVDTMKPFQVTNFAKFLAFLFIEGTLPLSVLKVIQLVEMTKGNVRLIRQILLSVLYNKDEQVAASVFIRLNKSSKLHLFKEGLRLFLHHFLLKNMKETDDDFNFLKERIQLADRALQSRAF